MIHFYYLVIIIFLFIGSTYAAKLSTDQVRDLFKYQDPLGVFYDYSSEKIHVEMTEDHEFMSDLLDLLATKRPRRGLLISAYDDIKVLADCAVKSVMRISLLRLRKLFDEARRGNKQSKDKLLNHTESIMCISFKKLPLLEQAKINQKQVINVLFSEALECGFIRSDEFPFLQKVSDSQWTTFFTEQKKSFVELISLICDTRRDAEYCNLVRQCVRYAQQLGAQ